MVLSMTCYSAPFDNPTEDSIGERFLREADKGAIAVFAASWRNTPSPAYSKGVIEELLKPGATIGEAIVRAKQRSQDRTLVEMYNLLGDPAVVLERPRDSARVVVDGNRWNPGVLVDLGQPTFDGHVTVDWLDAKGGKLDTSHYRVGDARFRLGVPRFANAEAATVRVYAASPGTGRDAVGGTDLLQKTDHASPWPVALADWWHDWRRPAIAPRVRQADTISIHEFEAVAPDTATAGNNGGGAAASSGAR